MIKLLIHIIYWLIEQVDKHIPEDSPKLIYSHIVNGIYVDSPEGWTPIAYVHETKPFIHYNLVTSGGQRLDCADEHILFNEQGQEVYVKNLKVGDKILTRNGLDTIIQLIKTNRKTCMCDVTVWNESQSFYSNDIVSHNTTTSAIFMLHYILFNVDKNSLVLGNKRKTAVEILDKTKKIFLELPYFLKPGVYKWNEAEVVLDNGCRIMAEATTINSGISFTFHCVLLDEAAHVAPNIIDKFYNNLFPTITAGRARFMITSTQNGYNLFYRIWKAAEAGENEYAPFKVDWYQVPEWNPDKHCWEKRDEEWRRLQVANYGGEEAFNSQFGTDFDLGANTLISRKILQSNKTHLVNFIEKAVPGVSASESWHWHPDYDITNLKNEFIVITADLGEQLGIDRTIYLISRMIDPGSAKLESIGYFMNNTLEREECARSLQELMCLYCNFENTLLSFERNTYGEMFVKHLEENQDKYHLIATRWDPSCLVKYSTDAGKVSYLGIKITPGNKAQHCVLFKESYERGNFLFEAGQFMNELSNFCRQGNSYAADWGHDDLVMAAVQTEFVKETLQYTIMKQLFDSTRQIQQDSTYYNPYDMSGVSSWPGDESSNVNDFGGMYNPYQQDQYDGSPLLSRLTRMG